jgi:hypothetical protein
MSRFAVASASRKTKRATTGETVTGVLYDLYGTDSESRGTIPFAVNWPEIPSTSTNLTVSNNTELATALATPNAHITVSAGSYNALVLAQDDQHWECADGAIFAGLSGNGFARVRINGGQIITSGDVTPYGFTDLALTNVYVECDDFNFGLGTVLFERLAIVHCTTFCTRTGFFVPGATANDAGVWATDLILAANYVSGGMLPGSSGIEAAFRIQSVIRSIVVDNRARCGFDGEGIKHTYRSHYGNQDFWMRRNLTEYGDGIYIKPRANADTIVANNYMGDHWVFDHEYHSTAKSAYAFRDDVNSTNYPGALVADGNDGYFDPSTGSGPYWAFNGQAGDTIGTNTSNAYTAPPALGSWLAADGLQPGADH